MKNEAKASASVLTAKTSLVPVETVQYGLMMQTSYEGIEVVGNDKKGRHP